MLYQRGWPKQRIWEAVSGIGRYGLGRTAMEKSVNFVFSPFSFSKKYLKYLTTLGDFTPQAPARALLLHVAVARTAASPSGQAWEDGGSSSVPTVAIAVGVVLLAVVAGLMLRALVSPDGPRPS